MRFPWLIFGLAFCPPAQASDTPLTLNEALSYAGQAHPDLDAAQAATALARANQLLAESQKDFTITLDAGLRTGHNSLTDSFSPDNFASLDARKLLWDGGRTGLATEASALEARGSEALYRDVLAKRRLALMTRFFDVLLTDMQYAVDNELTAVAYVNYDNGKDRQQVGEISGITLAELENRFQEIRQKREDDLRQARIKRSLLANAMNLPGQLPSELAEPEIRNNDRPLPELAALESSMETGNPQLQAQKTLLAAAEKRLEAQRASSRPSLAFEAGTASYSRDTLTRDDVHLGLNLYWPFYQGRQDDARIAQEQARFQFLQALYDRMRLDLRQSLRETYETIEYLRNAARQAAKVNSDYRDQALERARAEYELEMKTNLGTSMADIQAARLRRKSVDYQLALAWEKLDDLLGRPPATGHPANTTEDTK